jgi:hypothetical protein
MFLQNLLNCHKINRKVKEINLNLITNGNLKLTWSMKYELIIVYVHYIWNPAQPMYIHFNFSVTS